jgi:hypothetical protein
VGHRLYTVIALQGGPLQSCGLNMKCSAGLAQPAVLRRPRPGSCWSCCNMFQRLVWGILYSIYTVIALQGGPLQSCGLNMKCSTGLALPAVLSPLGPSSSRSGCTMLQKLALTKYGRCAYDRCIHGCSSSGNPDTVLTA